MKKILISIIFVLFAIVSFAQVSNGVVNFDNDTTTNTEVVNQIITSPNPITKNYSVAIVIIPTNESGTATVTAMPQGSLDNTNFFDLEDSAVTINNAGTPANAGFEYAAAPWIYYRIVLSSSGTGVTSVISQLGLKRL